MQNQFTPAQQDFLAALRSGEYTQGTGTLTCIDMGGTEKDCCLGVACKRAIKAGIDIDVERPEHNSHFVYGDGCAGSYVPNAVEQYLDFRREGRTYSHLASRNDSGHTFEQIADYIERYPWEVFGNFDRPVPVRGAASVEA